MTTMNATTMTTTSATCRECGEELAKEVRGAYAELFSSHAMLRLSDEMTDVLERDPAATADEVMLRALEHWLGCDVASLVAAVKHRQSEGYAV